MRPYQRSKTPVLSTKGASGLLRINRCVDVTVVLEGEELCPPCLTDEHGLARTPSSTVLQGHTLNAFRVDCRAITGLPKLGVRQSSTTRGIIPSHVIVRSA